MGKGMNKVFLLGNLGADPELRFATGGDPYLRLRLATNERYRDKNKEWHEHTEWHHVTLWGKRAQPLSQILHKGSHVMVEGFIRTSSYEKDGAMRYFTEVRARDIHLVGSPPGGGGMRAVPGPTVPRFEPRSPDSASAELRA